MPGPAALERVRAEASKVAVRYQVRHRGQTYWLRLWRDGAWVPIRGFSTVAEVEEYLFAKLDPPRPEGVVWDRRSPDLA